MPKKDNRKYKRSHFKIRIDYRDVDTFLTSFAINISEGGMFIKTKKPHPIGTEMTIKFLLPKTDKTISTKALVVWSQSEGEDDEKIGMGIEFQNLSEENVKIIREVVNNLTKEEKRK